MPVFLTEVNEFTELEKFRSVLIVPCRFCPAASLAAKRAEPYLDLAKNLLSTDAYEKYIRKVRRRLGRKGVKTDVFRSYWPHQFVVCMWTARRREKLMKRAMKYEAVLVMGCEAALETVHDAVKSGPCAVYQGMRTEGIMSIKPLYAFPGSISLQLNSITPVVHRKNEAEPWVCL